MAGRPTMTTVVSPLTETSHDQLSELLNELHGSGHLYRPTNRRGREQPDAAPEAARLPRDAAHLP
jgi:hypothetical protein